MLLFLFLQRRLGDRATVPPRVFLRRNVWAAGVFALFLGAAFILSTYFLPLWFQAVKGSSAVDSGLSNLPLLISVVFVSLAAGALVTLWGHYAPFMLLSTLFMSVGYGMISTFKPDTPPAAWVGYQLIAGAGVGLGLQQPLMAVQAVLPLPDVPTGTAIVVFLQTLGGAVSVSVGQAVFSAAVVSGAEKVLHGLDPQEVLHMGAAGLRGGLGGEEMEVLVGVFNEGIGRVFWVCAGAAAATGVGSGLVRWRSVKGRGEGSNV